MNHQIPNIHAVIGSPVDTREAIKERRQLRAFPFDAIRVDVMLRAA